MAKKAASKPPTPVSQLQIFNCDQNSDEWFELRLGLATASNFATIMASGKDGGPSLTRAKLLHRLAGEIITGEPTEEFRNGAMERGKMLEAEARESYVRRKNVDVRQIGFARNFTELKLCGASPDALIGFDGGLEIKTIRADLLIPLLKNPTSAGSEHRAQVQGNMMVLEREWWDLSLYAHSKMPALDIRIYRDDKYIAELSNQIERFNWDLKQLVESLRKMRSAG